MSNGPRGVSNLKAFYEQLDHTDLSARQGCNYLIDLSVTFDEEHSDIQELWDLWIKDRLTESVAQFKVVPRPANYSLPIEYTAWVKNGAGNTIRNNLVVQPEKNPSNEIVCTVRWDGKNDAGDMVPKADNYKICLKAKGEGKERTADSRKTKIIRVGVQSLEFHTYSLKFAFEDYRGAKYDRRDDDFHFEWYIDTLDDGGAPRKVPSCRSSGKVSDPSYCYPMAAKINEQLEFDATTIGENYDVGDGIRLRVVDQTKGRDWTEQPASDIEIGSTESFRAKAEFKLGDSVSRQYIKFNFIFEYTNSKGVTAQLGRQDCSQLIAYVVVSDPEVPWGSGEDLWVELLEKLCTDWAVGAKTVDEAAAKIVEAVNTKMQLKYHPMGGYDWPLIRKNALPNFTPRQISLRDFLKYLNKGGPPPATWNQINCSCCGALVSTMANCIGCSLKSSVMSHQSDPQFDGSTGTYEFTTGFNCVRVISIGHDADGFKYPLSQDGGISGGFSFHEVAWAGNAGASDKIYDACLRVASDPSQPGINGIFVKGIKFSDPSNDDYLHRLVDSRYTGFADVVAKDTMAGNYQPE